VEGISIGKTLRKNDETFVQGFRRKRLHPHAGLELFGSRFALTLLFKGSAASGFTLALCSR
jgi:hypothetical protein